MAWEYVAGFLCDTISATAVTVTGVTVTAVAKVVFLCGLCNVWCLFSAGRGHGSFI